MAAPDRSAAAFQEEIDVREIEARCVAGKSRVAIEATVLFGDLARRHHDRRRSRPGHRNPHHHVGRAKLRLATKGGRTIARAEDRVPLPAGARGHRTLPGPLHDILPERASRRVLRQLTGESRCPAASGQRAAAAGGGKLVAHVVARQKIDLKDRTRLRKHRTTHRVRGPVVVDPSARRKRASVSGFESPFLQCEDHQESGHWDDPGDQVGGESRVEDFDLVGVTLRNDTYLDGGPGTTWFLLSGTATPPDREGSYASYEHGAPCEGWFPVFAELVTVDHRIPLPGEGINEPERVGAPTLYGSKRTGLLAPQPYGHYGLIAAGAAIFHNLWFNGSEGSLICVEYANSNPDIRCQVSSRGEIISSEPRVNPLSKGLVGDEQIASSTNPEGQTEAIGGFGVVSLCWISRTCAEAGVIGAPQYR